MKVEEKRMSEERLRGKGIGAYGWFNVIEWMVQVR